jgi:ABC-type transport system substrate-binding protein
VGRFGLGCDKKDLWGTDKQPPLDDPIARQALAYATDSAAYIALQGDGQYQSAEGPFAPSSPPGRTFWLTTSRP